MMCRSFLGLRQCCWLVLVDMCYGVFLRRQQRSIASKGTILASKILLSHEEFQGLVTSKF